MAHESYSGGGLEYRGVSAGYEYRISTRGHVEVWSIGATPYTLNNETMESRVLQEVSKCPMPVLNKPMASRTSLNKI